MEYRIIDMEEYPRRAHFEYFNTLAQPYVGVTSEVDVSVYFKSLKNAKLPVFLSFAYELSRAANSIPELRRRIKDGGIIEWEWCRESHTETAGDGTYCYCTLDTRLPYEEFITYARDRQRLAREQNTLNDEGNDDVMYFSCVPTLTWTHLLNPTPIPADSVPRVGWGKITQKGDTYTMPVTLTANHALVDGLHISRFYETINGRFTQSV